MKELQSIINAYRDIERTNTPAVLATVVKVTGSAYRRPGARMLIAADGQTVGSVSGGCLERDVVNQAWRVLQWNDPRVVIYDSMSDDDIEWEFGLGCNGIVEVLIEPLSHKESQNHLAFLANCLHHRRAGVVATIFGIAGDTTARIGNRLLLSEQRPVGHDIGDWDLAEAILEDAQHALAGGTSLVRMYELAAGRAEVFIEVIQPPVPLIIFGAGHDAVPLARLAKELGWYVIVIDPRPGYATRTRFPSADALIVCRPEEVGARITLDERTVAVVMTHNFPHDAELLRTLLPSPIRYLGLLGPKRRTQRLLREAQEKGLSPTESHLDRIYGPIGLDIGADSPEEIALAAVAEIKAVLAGRSGGTLRAQREPLHEPSTAVDVITVSGKLKGAVYCGLEH